MTRVLEDVRQGYVSIDDLAAFAPVGRFGDALTLLIGALAGGQPTFTAPADASLLQRGSPVTFTWTPVTGAVSYLLPSAPC